MELTNGGEQTVATCPCCGAGVDPTRLLIDLNTNTIAHKGRAFHASPQIVVFLSVLDARRRIVTHEEMWMALWGRDAQPESRRRWNVQWLAHEAKVFLGSRFPGVTIEHVYAPPKPGARGRPKGLGYRMRITRV